MNRDLYIFISLNRNSYIINNSIIGKLTKKSIKFDHFLIIPKEDSYYEQNKVKIFYHDIISIFSFIKNFILYKNKNVNLKIILPHFDIPIIRFAISLIYSDTTKLFVVPDGVMFPSDLNFVLERKKDLRKKLLSFFNLKTIFYKLVNNFLQKVTKDRNYFYKKTYVLAFGEYFWEYYKLLDVNEKKYLSFGSPIFENLIDISENINETKTKIVTLFLQPFIEENWILENKFNEILNTTIKIFKRNNIKLIIKLHPSQNFSYYAKFLNITESENFIQLTSFSNNNQLIRNSDFILAYNTTVICNALILNKNVIIFNLFNFNRNNEYLNYLKLTKIDEVDELSELLTNFYINKNSLQKIDFNLLKSFISLNKNSSFDISNFIYSKND